MLDTLALQSDIDACSGEKKRKDHFVQFSLTHPKGPVIAASQPLKRHFVYAKIKASKEWKI